ncbi:MAG: GIY-YIG nuclease family protein [Candidatus Omnitrophica bacterium]|jgi:putative endonuclease|nr:GIY-YIG nuclease family protein [Candidatus Omnitrophota bacterium]
MRKQIKRKGKHYVYMLRCGKGTLYTGYTKDLGKRIELHGKGRGAKYLRGRGSVELAYVKEYRCYKNALNAERRIKKLRQKQKEEMVKIYGKKGDVNV